jgi:hypothetical protein
MLNKHENPSETSKSKHQKQKQNECMTNILNTDAQKHNKRTKEQTITTKHYKKIPLLILLAFGIITSRWMVLW